MLLPEQDPDDVPIGEVIPLLEAAINSPSYRNTVCHFTAFFLGHWRNELFSIER